MLTKQFPLHEDFANYYKSHMEHSYDELRPSSPGVVCYHSILGWNDCYFGKSMIFSHRTNTYNMSCFPEKLHAHLFYEMDIYLSGEISYISNNREIIPSSGSIVVFPPGVLHTAHQSEKSEYERFVFYFTADYFEDKGGLPPFLMESDARALRMDPEALCRFRYILDQILFYSDQIEPDTLLKLTSLIFDMYVLINRSGHTDQKLFQKLPSNVLQVKNYIDENIREISTASSVADHFFYSREYVSRLFRQYFNISISEYIAERKISNAKSVLENGKSVTEAYNCSGYRSMSSFINAFKSYVHLTPSAYKKQCTKDEAANQQ